MENAQRIVFIQSQIIAAEIHLESMRALNAERLANDMAPGYDEAIIYDLIEQYGLGHNQVMQYLGGQ